MDSPSTTTQYKVEWVDNNGSGHLVEFTDSSAALDFANAVAVAELSMIGPDLYIRTVTEWERNPRV